MHVEGPRLGGYIGGCFSDCWMLVRDTEVVEGGQRAGCGKYGHTSAHGSIELRVQQQYER